MCRNTTVWCSNCNNGKSTMILCEYGKLGVVCVNESLMNADLSWSMTMNTGTKTLSGVVPIPDRIEDKHKTVVLLTGENQSRGVATIPIIKTTEGWCLLLNGILPVTKEQVDTCSRCEDDQAPE